MLFGATLAVSGVLTVGFNPLQAQDDVEGIIRISDCMPGSSPAASGADCPQAGNSSYGTTGYCPGNCPNEMGQGCPPGGYGNCPSGYGHCGSGGCYGRCHCTQKVYAFLHWLDPHGPCSHSPDHGWAPPGKMPLWRKPVAYNTFFPNSWTGQQGATGGIRAQQVYQPTDTSQMGYYYQHVPYWQPNPAMIPPAPNPTQWHQPLAGGNYGVTEASYCPETTAPYEIQNVESQPTPTPTPTTEELPAPQEPVEPPAPPPPPIEPSALDLQKPAGAPELLPTPGHPVAS